MKMLDFLDFLLGDSVTPQETPSANKPVTFRIPGKLRERSVQGSRRHDVVVEVDRIFPEHQLVQIDVDAQLFSPQALRETAQQFLAFANHLENSN